MALQTQSERELEEGRHDLHNHFVVGEVTMSDDQEEQAFEDRSRRESSSSAQIKNYSGTYLCKSKTQNRASWKVLFLVGDTSYSRFNIWLDLCWCRMLLLGRAHRTRWPEILCGKLLNMP